MKRILTTFLLAAALAPAALADTAPVAVKWIMGENMAEPQQYSSRFVITNVSRSTLDDNWGFYFNLFPVSISTADGSMAAIEEIVPNYYVLRPTDNYAPVAPGDSLVVEFFIQGTYRSRSFAPDGGHFAFDNQLDNTMAVDIVIPPLTDPRQWQIGDSQLFNYPDGEFVYNFNQEVNPDGASLKGNVFNIFPTPKSIRATGGSLQLPASISVTASGDTEVAAAYLKEKLAAIGISTAADGSKTTVALSILSRTKGKSAEYYELTVARNGKITIAGASAEGALNGVKTLVAAIEGQWEKTEKTLPCVRITDYPDIAYRGVMLDIARNYTNCSDMKKMIDLMAAYKINRLQFHFCDDEAWRLEIPGLPELTEVGARKGLTLDEKEFLVQTYRGSGDPDDKTTTANGYYTRSEFIDMLRYAASRGITVVPEVETPGHARAAIVAMKARHARYAAMGDIAEAERYRLWDDDDTSVYTSAQGFHDNILCIGHEGVYRFLEKVINEIDLMYQEAGLKLTMLHFGGDEVPEGSWERSPIVQDFMKQYGLASVHEAREYFIDRVTAFLASKDIKVSGWQEVAQGHSDEYNARIAPRFGGVNAWSTVGERTIVPYTLANNGYPVILSNVNNFYFDLAYSRHQDEGGLTWGGVTDEFATWEAQPYNIYRTRQTYLSGRPIDLAKAADGKVNLTRPENIVGVQGQLFAETIEGFDMVQLMVFPKLFGLAERGWNARPSWGEQYTDRSLYLADRVQYNLKVGTRELPIIARKGANFHIAQPGIIIEDGKLLANTRHPGVEVRFTTDGSLPTRQSQLWTGPVAIGNAKVIKARAYYLGKESVATFLFVK